MILPDAKEILYTLDEFIQRYTQQIGQKIQQSTQTLKHVEEMLMRSSPTRRLEESHTEFKRLEEEFQRVIAYKLERFSLQLPSIKRNFEQNIHFLLQQKEQYLKYLLKKIEMNDPKLQCKKGWAQVLHRGEAIELKILKENDLFTIEDASVKIEARCLSKKTY